MEKPNDTITGFDRVDQMANPAFFTQFMDKSHTLQSASIYRQRMFDLLDVGLGATLLDVGCGAGNDVQDLAKQVGPSGRVVGIDSSATMIQEARRRTADAHLPVEYIQGDAYQLPFQENTFDGCQSSRVFKHLAEPGRVLAEMVRVARPGARVVVAEADFDLTIVDIPDRTLARKMIHLACDSLRQGWMGRQLPKLFSEVGLSDIVITGHVLSSDYAYFQMVFGGLLQDAQAAGKVSAEELTRFWDLLEQADRQQRLLGYVGFVVGGRKP
ncbi:MAG: methyltransferase domain-containing protein [Chloroflexi bacterium]|nr:MAG: methyltransferase domain-containing protein [Chloroflexota bacterium]